MDSERNGQEELTAMSNPQRAIYMHYTGCFLIKPQCKQYNSENLWTDTTTVSWAESSVSWTESEIQSPTKTVPTKAESVEDIGQVGSSAVFGFWWYDNHFADTTAANSRELLNQFQTFCQDQDDELQKFCSQFIH